MKDGWKEAEDRVPDSYSFKLIQIKAKPHESVFSFIHALRKRIIHCPPPCGQLTASLKREKLNFTAFWSVFYRKRLSEFVPPWAKQSSGSLPDCFSQINIFPKDLYPKQQPRLKSNTTQTFGSSIVQRLQVLGTLQSVVVYSIAKIFSLTLCLYVSS